jgi:hypothetical protein
MAITTGKVKSAGPFTMVQIEFGPNEKPFKRINQLELVSDTPEDFAALLAKRKWSGPDALRRALAVEKIRGQLTDVFYSMESSRTDFYPHQFKPVVKFVESPTGRILIADCRYVGTPGTLPVNSLIWDGGSIHDERRTRHSTQT